MQNVLRISEALSLGLHAATFMAVDPDKKYSNSEIAKALKVSKAHLSKVLQRLVRASMIKSNRGPNGGFSLVKKDASLLEVYEAIEGPFRLSDCVFEERVCGTPFCIFGSLILETGKKIKEYLSETKISDLTYVYRRSEKDDQKDCEHR